MGSIMERGGGGSGRAGGGEGEVLVGEGVSRGEESKGVKGSGSEVGGGDSVERAVESSKEVMRWSRVSLRSGVELTAEMGEGEEDANRRGRRKVQSSEEER